jgi:ABC-type lipoprotein export system ATPase subunit
MNFLVSSSVAVARALINKPAIIFADEPSGNLDTASAENLHQLFSNYEMSSDKLL